MAIEIISSLNDIVQYLNSGDEGKFIDYYFEKLNSTAYVPDKKDIVLVIKNEDLSTVNFPKPFRLSQVTFKKCNFTKVDFSHAELTGIKFIESDLCGTNFSTAKLRNVRIEACKSYASNPVDFTSATIEDSEIYKSELPNAIFSRSGITRLSMLDNPNINAIKFNEIAEITDLRITRCNAESADFSKAHIHGLKIEESNIQEANFSKLVTYDNHKVEFSNLTKAASVNFEGTTLKNVKFYKVELHYPDFSDAKIVSVDVAESKLLYPNFNNAELDRIVCDDKTETKAASLRKAKGAALPQFKIQVKKKDTFYNSSSFGICKTDANGLNKRFELQKIGFNIVRAAAGAKFVVGENSWFNWGLGAFSGIVNLMGEKGDLERFVTPELGYINNVLGDYLAVIGALAPPLVTSQVFGSVGVLFLSLISTALGNPLPASDFTIAGSAVAQLGSAVVSLTNEYNNLYTPREKGDNPIYDNAPEDNYDRNERLFKSFKQNVTRYSAFARFLSSPFNLVMGLIFVSSLAVLVSAVATAPMVALVPIAGIFLGVTAIYCVLSINSIIKDLNSIIDNNSKIIGDGKVTDVRQFKKNPDKHKDIVQEGVIEKIYNTISSNDNALFDGKIKGQKKEKSWREIIMQSVGMPTGYRI